MFGNVMYEVAKQRIAEQERAASRAGEARRQRAAARGRKRRGADSVVPPIPDYAEDLLAVAQNAVPAPREEAPDGRHARAGH